MARRVLALALAGAGAAFVGFAGVAALAQSVPSGAVPFGAFPSGAGAGNSPFASGASLPGIDPTVEQGPAVTFPGVGPDAGAPVVRPEGAAVSGALPAFGVPPGGPRQTTVPAERDKPAYYQADQVEYDQVRGIVTLTGRVEFWQNERLLLAQKVTYDRTRDIAVASGNVVLLEPDGQTVFTDEAELSGGMKDGVLTGLRALLSEGGRLVANGGRRTDGRVNELSRVVYSTCALCAEAPERAPLWQIRAREAIQDRDNKRVEYHDAVVDMWGIPVFYTPFLTHPDPSEKRASGVLPPLLGYSKHLGAFAGVPYFWAINGQSDATITPILATRNGPAADVQYRHRFNTGTLTVNASIANASADLGGHIFARGQFAIDETWRWGFDLNRASSAKYVRDFRVQGWSEILASRLYLEGFGQGSYARVDARTFQGLSSSIQTSRLPTVLPRAEYSLIGPQDLLGGRTNLEVDAFNLIRDEGTSTRRVRGAVQWDRPEIGRLGEVWKFSVRLDAAAYSASKFNYQPNYGKVGSVESSQAMPTVAVELRWPLMRDAGDWGTQVVEPIVQVAAAPRSSTYRRTLIPNEDALGTDFTDANLFSLNRNTGSDRLEGGLRANVAIRGTWYLKGGTVLLAQVGQGFRTRRDDSFAAGSGLERTASDIVSRLSITPSRYLDVTSRQRFSAKTGQIRYFDALGTVGSERLRLNGGYIYTFDNPLRFYDFSPGLAPLSKPRNEVTTGFAAQEGQWRLRGFARRDVQTGKMVAIGGGVAYEDECFIFDVGLYRRYTSINTDRGASTVLFQVTLKTVGQLGFHAL